MLKAAEFESVVIPDLMSDVFVLSSRPKIIAISLFPYSIHSTIFLYNVHRYEYSLIRKMKLYSRHRHFATNKVNKIFFEIIF